ncbi:ribosomal protein S12 methylthiotransferase accessory factor [Seinonella peptonophila]|uniref:Ribosomal protein S12 methylthiotransferase accessory factor n=1 Tax=Seinonella peptonophila TaxID=112248 RepID=A0A1M4TZC4_9BACL|nr:TOMM precursor leader peptide-binding protein [Seinonella peptonophila]SHE49760.1 ribosomal protein S12 methylthiotransferase accessory factor [Seinonella peptonophila]
MSADVWIVGKGHLANFVASNLSSQYSIIRHLDFVKDLPNTRLALVLHDAWYPAIHQTAEKLLQKASVPWLSGYLSFGEGFIGPLVDPGTPGCSQCAIYRRLMAGRDRKYMWEIYQRKNISKDANQEIWGTYTSIRYLAQLVTYEVDRILQGKPSYVKEKIRCLHLRTLQSSLHSFLPNPLCPVCSQVALDSSEQARITLQSSPKVKPYTSRTLSLDELKQILANDYLDNRTGCLNGCAKDTTTPFADVVVNLPLFTVDEATAGRTLSFADSESAAILEGLERYCGLSPRGKQTAVFDCYHHLQTEALNPFEVGVHSPEQYSLPKFPFRPFDPQQPIKWVWGYSLIQKRPILVPEVLAYYSLGHKDGFVYETSNGCALGGSLEEAIFYGILEVVERDAFLMAWYGKLALAPLELASANDTELAWMVQRLQSVAGYNLHLFNATMENDIPTIWALAKNRKSAGLHLICAAGAHLNPIQAVKSAIHEIAGMVNLHTGTHASDMQKCREMLTNPSLVQQMEDHSLLYGLPEAEERFDFLLDTRTPVQTFDELRWAIDPNDITCDLRKMLTKFKDLDMNVIVINQTTPELKRNNLYCVKVLIPGMLPMTFGHHLTRLTGLDRVRNVPMQLGYVQRPLSLEELNPHPHPFP